MTFVDGVTATVVGPFFAPKVTTLPATVLTLPCERSMGAAGDDFAVDCSDEVADSSDEVVVPAELLSDAD